MVRDSEGNGHHGIREGTGLDGSLVLNDGLFQQLAPASGAPATGSLSSRTSGATAIGDMQLTPDSPKLWRPGDSTFTPPPPGSKAKAEELYRMYETMDPSLVELSLKDMVEKIKPGRDLPPMENLSEDSAEYYTESDAIRLPSEKSRKLERKNYRGAQRKGSHKSSSEYNPASSKSSTPASPGKFPYCQSEFSPTRIPGPNYYASSMSSDVGYGIGFPTAAPIQPFEYYTHTGHSPTASSRSMGILKSPKRSPRVSPRESPRPYSDAPQNSQRRSPRGSPRASFGASMGSNPTKTEPGDAETGIPHETTGSKQNQVAFDTVLQVHPSNRCSTCSSYILFFKARCLVCGRAYCKRCVKDAMGAMPEGRKCKNSCLGRHISKRFLHEAGRTSCCWPFGLSNEVREAELDWGRRRPRSTRGTRTPT